MMGNHRDAWILGAVDPSSGTAALMEIVRAFATFKSQGHSCSHSFQIIIDMPIKRSVSGGRGETASERGVLQLGSRGVRVGWVHGVGGGTRGSSVAEDRRLSQRRHVPRRYVVVLYAVELIVAVKVGRKSKSRVNVIWLIIIDVSKEGLTMSYR